VTGRHYRSAFAPTRGPFARRLARPSSGSARGTIDVVEEGDRLMLAFDARGLVPVVVQDADARDVLMLGWMNAEALRHTLESGWMHFWSRARRTIWRKGECSGQAQRLVELRVDDDQDCLLASVRLTGGASCHTGYRSCFFRELDRLPGTSDGRLRFREHRKVFDPAIAYALHAATPTGNVHGN